LKTILTHIAAGLLFSSMVSAADTTNGNGGLVQLAAADITFWDEEDALIIATGTAKPVHLAPSVATVITAEEIKAMGATTLWQALETVPGMHIYPKFNALGPGVSIRGIHTAQNPQILLLRNGIPIKVAGNSAIPTTYRAPIANIARIEIIRGPGSALHGADAFSGIINIVTKDAQEIGGTAFGARAGSFDSQEGWFQYGHHYGNLEVAFNLEYATTDGDRDRVIESDLQSNFDGLFGTSASLAPGPLETGYEYWDGSLNLKYKNWGLDLWHFRQNSGIGISATQNVDPEGGEDYEYYQAAINYNNSELHPDWDLNARFDYNFINAQRWFMLLPPGATVPIGADGNLFTPGGGLVTFTDGMHGNPGWEQNKYTLDLSAIYTGFKNHSIRLGSGFSKRDNTTNSTQNFGPGVIDGTVSPINGDLANLSSGDPGSYMDDQDRQRWHASFQDEWQFASDWELTAGIRYDHYSDFGKTVNPRVALVWATDHNLTTKLLYGRAFRTPSMVELYTINNPVALGDPGLEPERIDTGELAFDYWPSFDLNTKLNLFYYDMDDAIEILPSGGGSRTATNTKGQRGYGFELEAEWEATDHLKLRSNFAWQHSESKDNGHHRIADAPGRQFHLSGDWRFRPDWLLNTQLDWIGSRKRTSTDSRDKVDSYSLVNLTLRRANVARNWEFAASVRNLFDTETHEPSTASTPSDYPMPGRSAFVEVRYTP